MVEEGEELLVIVFHFFWVSCNIFRYGVISLYESHFVIVINSIINLMLLLFNIFTV